MLFHVHTDALNRNENANLLTMANDLQTNTVTLRDFLRIV